MKKTTKSNKTVFWALFKAETLDIIVILIIAKIRGR